jgi:broad specificity phosphatase PhoE
LRQADLLADYLAGIKVEAIYSSPRQRALKTVHTIAQCQQLEVRPVAEIDDICFGRWEGKSVSQVKERRGFIFTVGFNATSG